MAPTSYQYSPLPQPTPGSFRISTLDPAHAFSAAIRGKLHVSFLSPSSTKGYVWERFEALSYAWDDVTATGVIELPGNSCLPIVANLASFLRCRRQQEQSVGLWIDAICINQQDSKEKSSQVQAMGQIYALASRLSIWLGSPSNDSTFAISVLGEISREHTFCNLSIALDESAAISNLLNRAWWFRVWVIQELALGGVGNKYERTTLWCGSDRIAWMNLVLACSRIHVNALNMRQTFPAVENVLSLDALPSRCRNELASIGESRPCRLLRQLSKHRGCLASDPRDKIYALLGLWIDVGRPVGMPQTSAPIVNYDHRVVDIYIDFVTWIVLESQSLELLHHCQPQFLDSLRVGSLPTWDPNWSQAPAQARLPCGEVTKRSPIPWWSLPIHSNSEDERRVQYCM